VCKKRERERECVKEKGTTHDKVERKCVCLMKTYHACNSERESEVRRYTEIYCVVVCNGERETPSTWPREVWKTRERRGRERRMEKMEAWGGREGVFVIERSPRDRVGTIWVGDRETMCVCDRKIPRKRTRYA
jgi:hypothetical protein